MEFTEWFVRETTNPTNQRDHVVCKDGFTISIQASKYHYCVPKVNGSYWYDLFELGYPSHRDELIEKLCECEDGDVYPYVEREIVNELIAKHGGFDHFKGEA